MNFDFFVMSYLFSPIKWTHLELTRKQVVYYIGDKENEKNKEKESYHVHLLLIIHLLELNIAQELRYLALIYLQFYSLSYCINYFYVSILINFI